MPGPIKITVLGSGTSVGVPTIGCECVVCLSADPRDKRLRPSVLIGFDGRHVLVDTTPDLRYQALRAGIKRLDAVIYTHAHADHIMGLDDVRPFNYHQKGPLPIYGAPGTLASIQRTFHYIFDGRAKESHIPHLELRALSGEPFTLFGLDFTPVPLLHGKWTIYGFRFGNAAYLTDHSDIPAASLELLQGLDVLFLDALRYKPHPTHSTVDRSIQTVNALKPKRAFFTHICHDLGHARAESLLPEGVRLAYDGLELLVERPE